MAALTFQMRRLRTLAPRILLALALVPAQAHAQHSLVLSGGGARGLAHAGVLVGIEQLGYAPGAVAGTSMGAIIGALYAAGYTPTEIWHTMAQEDWRALFVADPFPVGPDREPRRPLFSIAFLHGAEPVLGGFVPETGINRRLTQLLFDAGVRAGNDFDSLPRPFRAIAADLRTGEEVVLARGDLARAARASMAVPGAFAPVRWGERVLIDGAIANNLPIRVVRTLARAPVIAVDVVRPAGELQEVSALDIGVRAVRLLLLNARSAREARDTAELFIVPPIPFRWSEAAFPEDAGPLLTVGYEGALAQLPPTPRAAQARAVPHAAPTRLDSLVVEGADPSTYALVRRTFRGALGSYAPERVLERMDALYASGMFQGVWPRVERDSATGAHLLVVRAEPTAPALITGAAGWDSDLGARGWAALRARARLLSPLELSGALSADRLSTSVAGSANFYSTLLPPWALSAGGHWRENRVREFDGEDIAGTARVRRKGAWIGAERRDLGPQRSIALLLRAEQVSADAGADGASFGALLRLSAPPPSDAVIGIPSMAEIEVRGGDVAYTRLHVAGDAHVYSGAWRAALIADGVYVHGTLPPVDVLPYVGGRDGASWLREGELRGQARVLGGVDVAHPFLLDGHLRLRVRGGAAAPDPDALRDVPWTVGAELGAVWNTAVGPVAAGAAIGRDSRWRLQLGIGAEW